MIENILDDPHPDTPAEMHSENEGDHEVEADHDWAHFTTDLFLLPHIQRINVYSGSGEFLTGLALKDSGHREELEQNRMAIIQSIIREGAGSRGQTWSQEEFFDYFIPFTSEKEIQLIFEISVEDNDLYSDIRQNILRIIRIISTGGFALYTLLFFLFFRSYQTQNRTLSHLKKSQSVTIRAMSLLSELRDNETGDHIERTSEYCRLLAEELRKKRRYRKYLTPRYIEDLVQSAPLHDIGKVGIPDRILLKPGKLSPEEFETIKKHPVFGAHVLKEAMDALDFQSYLNLGYEIALNHHENWDGSGYPHGLSGEQIPLSARIMALADVYDALRTARPYKEAFSCQKAEEIIQEGDGKKFDPEIVRAFTRIAPLFREISETYVKKNPEGPDQL